jgi:hypothetical protein
MHRANVVELASAASTLPPSIMLWSAVAAAPDVEEQEVLPNRGWTL